MIQSMHQSEDLFCNNIHFLSPERTKMNQILRFRLVNSLLSRASIRPFHLSSTRSIEWADIDEYTNKVNSSVFITTDVYEKDGTNIFSQTIFYIIFR